MSAKDVVIDRTPPLEVGHFLIMDASPRARRLVFKGTRLAAETVLNELGKGKDVDSLLTRWPKLRAEAIAEAVQLATEALLARTTVAALPEKPHHEGVRIGRYLIVHPGICSGKLTFAGTRVPVSTVLAYLAKGSTIERLLAGWPDVQRPALAEAIRLAARALRHQYTAGTGKANEPIRAGRSA